MFDMHSMKQAIERADADSLIGMYADAEMVIIDRNTPPSMPMRLRGKEAIAGFWRDVCGRNMSHNVHHEMQDSQHAAFVEDCVYPDGCHVTSAMMLDLRDGHIARHMAVQAWDDAKQ